MTTVKMANRCIPTWPRENPHLESKLELKMKLTWQAGSFRGTLELCRELGLKPATSTYTLKEFGFERKF